MSSGTEAPADLNAMMNLEILKMMQKMNKRLSGESSTDSEDGEQNNGDPDLTGITKMRKKFRGKPEVFLKEFAARTKSVRTLGPGQTNTRRGEQKWGEHGKAAPVP